jgi:hypothetical protein
MSCSDAAISYAIKVHLTMFLRRYRKSSFKDHYFVIRNKDRFNCLLISQRRF